MNQKLRTIVYAAVIAALYAALTYAFEPISFGQVQFRVSEILTVLPFFTPAAVPGLFIGCILGNLMSPLGIVDIAFGSAATLLAAFLSSHIKIKWLVPLPPVIVNGIIVGIELRILTGAPLLITMAYVAAGEAVVCFGGGIPLILALERVKGRIFKKP